MLTIKYQTRTGKILNALFSWGTAVIFFTRVAPVVAVENIAVFAVKILLQLQLSMLLQLQLTMMLKLHFSVLLYLQLPVLLQLQLSMLLAIRGHNSFIYWEER